MSWLIDVGVQASDAGDGKVIAGNIGSWPAFAAMEGFWNPTQPAMTSEKLATSGVNTTAARLPTATAAGPSPGMFAGISAQTLLIGAAGLLVVALLFRK